ncbi:T-complex protein 1 subunit alpha [Dictyocoela muelleri]|nr:T-complex protein 1 subunit alpha [Dictyocoela muelleri]
MRELSLSDITTGNSRISGLSVRERNLKAVLAVSNAIKSSFGALGLDKMCIDNTGDVTITNDGATILHMMNVDDPVARILVDLARQQDVEVGDGTTGVVLLAASLIEGGVKLINKGVHPSLVVSGFKMAYKECQRFINKKLEIPIARLGNDLTPVINTTLSSKVIHSPHFIKLIYDAVKQIECNRYGALYYPIEEIQILKKEGNSMDGSFLINGYAINCIPASESMLKKVKNPRIILIDFDLRKMKMPLGAQIVTENPDQLESMRLKESEVIVNQVKMILSKANVIFSSKGIDDICLKPIIEAGGIGVRRVKYEDLKNLSRILNIPILTTLSDLEGSDKIEHVGSAESVTVETIGDDECIFVNTKKRAASIILRGANEELLMEMERNVHDALCVLKRTLESKSVLPGGGAFECALSIFLEEFASTISTKEQLAIYTFAKSLREIPKLLASNAGLDPNEMLARLISFQSEGNAMRLKDCFEYGLDVNLGLVQNNIVKGIVEPSIIKIRALRAATEAAMSILRIDEITFIAPKVTKKKEECVEGDGE